MAGLTFVEVENIHVSYGRSEAVRVVSLRSRTYEPTAAFSGTLIVQLHMLKGAAESGDAVA